MSDYQGFLHGNVEYPLDLSATTTYSLLRDADPCVYYALEFFASVITTHLGARLLEEATAVGMTRITAAVAETIPLDPDPYLAEGHYRFPLLAVYRKQRTYEFVGNRKRSVDHMEAV